MNRTRTLVAAAAGVLAAAVVCSAAGLASAQSAAQPLTVVSVDTSHAPDVELVVAAPPQLAGRTLDASAFSVREGDGVPGVQATQAPAVTVEALPADQLELSLVVDTSGSMAGAPLTAAKAAARALLNQLPANVPVSVIGFGATPVIASARTSDRGAVLSAIDGLAANGETALYDAVQTGIGQFSSGGTVRRFVVLLSDGGDTASRATLEATAKALEASHVTVFAVELKTAESNGAALARLAVAGGGQSVSADNPAALASVFDGVAKQLVRQYRLSWRTTALGPVDVDVAVQSAGIRAEARPHLELPVLDAAAAAPSSLPVQTSGSGPGPDGLFSSWAFTAGVVLFGLAILLAVIPSVAFWTPRSTALGGGRLSTADRGLRGVGERARRLADHLLSRADKGAQVNDLLERAGIDMRASELVVVVACATLVVGLAAGVLVSPIVGLVAGAAPVAAARVVLEILARRRREQFGEQLGDALQMIAGALRAGYGLSQAIDVVAREAESPTSDEFRRLTVESRLGREFEGALRAMAERVRSEDFDWVVQSFEIHREVGGDLVEVLDNVSETIRDRNKVRRHVKAVTAEGKMSATVLFVLPLMMAAAMSVFNPDYLGELTSSGAGLTMLAGGATLLALGGLWLRKIVKPNF